MFLCRSIREDVRTTDGFGSCGDSIEIRDNLLVPMRHLKSAYGGNPVAGHGYSTNPCTCNTIIVVPVFYEERIARRFTTINGH